MIIQRKYAALPMCKLTPEQVKMTGKALCVRVSILTGWAIPPEPQLQNILYDQLSKYLVEMWPTLNHEEIEYAFRTKSSNVKDWGKSMNLGLFTEVLEPYMAERKQASIIEAQMASKIENEKKQLPMPEMTNKERIAEAYEIWKGMKSWEYILSGTYQALKMEGLVKLSMEDQEAYMRTAKTIANQKEDKDREYFRDLDKDEWLKNTCRKLAVNKYFENYVPL